MSEILPQPSGDNINFFTWNVYLDKTRARLGIVEPQHKRVESQAKTLTELAMDLDVVMLQEAEGTNGQRIAELTGNEPGFWDQHNRREENIGVFGNMVESAEFYTLSSGRKVVMTKVGGLAVFGVHFSARPKRYFVRVQESRELCELTNKVDEAAVMGDFNGPWWEEARRMLARRGFTSAIPEDGSVPPPIYPTEQYRDIMWTPFQQAILRRWVSLDDIMVRRGVKVINAGTFVGESDHPGVFATVQR